MSPSIVVTGARSSGGVVEVSALLASSLALLSVREAKRCQVTFGIVTVSGSKKAFKTRK